MYLNFIMNKNEVELIKHSAVIQMSNKMSSVQRKCYNAFLYVAKKQLDENPGRFEFEIDAEILLKFYEIGEKHYFYLKEKLKELAKIQVEYNVLGKDKENEWGVFNILAGIEYKEGKFYFSFPHQVLKTLINPNVYSYVDLVIIKDLKSKYAIALYELLKDYKEIKELRIEIEKFRELMGVKENQYRNFNNFREKVIDKAINEINKSSKIDFTVEYELKKTGKKYSYIIFIIKKKAQFEIERLRLENKKENAKTEILLALIPEEFRSKSIKSILIDAIEQYKISYIEEQIKYINRQSNIKNYGAYLKLALLEDYAGYEEKKEIKERYKDKIEEYLVRAKRIKERRGLKKEIKEIVKDLIFSDFNLEKITFKEKDILIDLLEIKDKI